jgi:ATP-dependent DNA helicase UvrD/PcrA
MIVAAIERLLGGTTHFSLDSGRVASHEDGISVGFGDIGILYRLNAQGDAIQEALSRAGIPLVRSGERPLIETPLVKLVWRFLQTVRYPETPFYLNAYARTLDETGLGRPDIGGTFELRGNLPGLIERVIRAHGLTRENGEEAEASGRLMERAEHFEGNLPAFLDSLALERGIDHGYLTGDRVALMSLHAAKGLEWPVVFLTGCEDRLIPCTLFGDRDDAEERRLFYVGMTRARSRLILSHARRRSINGRVLEMGPSPFLEMLPPEICLPLERGEWKPKGRPHQQLRLF